MKRSFLFMCELLLLAIAPTVAFGQTKPASALSAPGLFAPTPEWLSQEGRLVGEGLGDLQRDRVSELTGFPQQVIADAQRQLGLKPEQAEKLVSWTMQSGQTAMDRFAIRVRIDLKAGVDREKAKKFIADEFAALKKLAVNLIEQQRAQDIAAGEKRVKETDEALAKLSEQLRTLRRSLQERSNEIDVLPNALSAAATKVQTQFQQLDLDHSAKESRQKAIEEAIAKLSTEVEAKIKDDPVARELGKVVEYREKELERVKAMAKSNDVSAADVDRQVASAAEARAKLLERRREAASDAGGNLIAQLNRDLLMLSIDSAEENTRYKILRTRGDALRSCMDDAERLQTLQKQAAALERQLSLANQELATNRQKQANERIDLQTAEFRMHSAPGDSSY